MNPVAESRRRSVLAILCGACVLFPSCTASNSGLTTTQPTPHLELHPCNLPSSDLAFRCGVLRVEENRQNPNGRTLPLKIVVSPPLAGEPGAEPVFFLAGGPGQAATEIAGDVGIFGRLENRAIVFIDQRGSGEGHRLECDIGDPTDVKLMIEPLFTEGAAVYRECRRQLEARADLTQYTTSQFIDDLEQARQALGYDTINIEGGSYGSLAAFAYMQRYPNHIRSALFSGIATLASRAPLGFPAAAQHAFDEMIAQCGADARCRDAYPTISDDLDSVRRRLRGNPAAVASTHPATGESVAFALDEAAFTDAVRVMLYSAETARTLPSLLQRARRGDLQPFADAALESGYAFRQGINLGLLLSATCSEGVNRIRPEEIADAVVGNFIGDHRIRGQIEACGEWPTGDLPADFLDFEPRSIPTLLLSGKTDPVTPPSQGEELRRWLPNGLHLVSPGAHVAFDDCILSIRQRFFAAGSIHGLDTRCISQQELPPFAYEE